MNNISLKKVLFSEKKYFPDKKLTKISRKKLFVLYKTSREGEGKTICKIGIQINCMRKTVRKP